MIQLCASAYAYFIISLYCTISIIVVGNFSITALIPILGDGKWLLKVTHFEKDDFKLKIEPMLMCNYPYFHNKPKQLEYLQWHPIC